MLKPWVECYWAVNGNDTSIQKIIPDGFSELIFHLGDEYTIRKENTAASQSRAILAGQINRPIFLQPKGVSDVVGIKFKPSALWQLTGLKMSLVTNEAVDLRDIVSLFADVIHQRLQQATCIGERIRSLDNVLLSAFEKTKSKTQSVDVLIDCVNNSRGAVSIRDLSTTFKISARKLERLFQEQVGVTAKQYARLVRFNHVFQLIQQPNLKKTDVSFLAGYFDQSHFNNEFREFTGENPENYFLQNHAFANFFMNR